MVRAHLQGKHGERLHGRLTPTPTREAMVETLLDRTYVDQQGILVSNGLSTELICFPSDAASTRQSLLNEKIENALAYATSFQDMASLQALRMVPKQDDASHIVPPDNYLALGLYLYLADECSRLQTKQTFLTAMRKAGAELKAGERVEPEQLLQKVKGALKLLHMEESHGPLIDEWHQHRRYTICGEEHSSEHGHLKGAYALLAKDISLRQKFLGMNLAISYALGNKHEVEHKTPEEAYYHTKQSLLPDHHEHIGERIERGERIRKRRILDIVHQKIPAALPLPQATRKARGLIEQLPDGALEMLCREGFTIAYSDHTNLSNCYPKEDLPGLSPSKNLSTREGSTGAVQGRYRIIFLCNGKRQDKDDVQRDEQLRQMVVGQTLLHEVMHMVISYLNDDERKELEKAVLRAHEAVVHTDGLPAYMGEKLKTLDINTLADTVNYQSKLYRNYNWVDSVTGESSDTRWHEVACNAYALKHTEFAQAKDKPFEDVPALKALSQALEQAVELALPRCREAYPELKCGKMQR